jgi:hypothetical protein
VFTYGRLPKNRTSKPPYTYFFFGKINKAKSVAGMTKNQHIGFNAQIIKIIGINNQTQKGIRRKSDHANQNRNKIGESRIIEAIGR